MSRAKRIRNLIDRKFHRHNHYSAPGSKLCPSVGADVPRGDFVVAVSWSVSLLATADHPSPKLLCGCATCFSRSKNSSSVGVPSGTNHSAPKGSSLQPARIKIAVLSWE
jgi:hypothetical protein